MRLELARSEIAAVEAGGDTRLVGHTLEIDVHRGYDTSFVKQDPHRLVPVDVAREMEQADAFRQFHQRLFLAHFRDNLDIGRQDVLWRVARDAGLDLERFERDYGGGEAYRAAPHDYAEGTAWFGVSAVPTVIFNEKVSLVGAVPEDRYRSILDWIIDGEPGGLVPLEPEAPAAGLTRPGSE